MVHLIRTLQLVQGHSPSHTIFNTRQQINFENMVVCHVSTASLNNANAPTLLNTHKLSAHEKRLQLRILWSPQSPSMEVDFRSRMSTDLTHSGTRAHHHINFNSEI